MTEPQKSERPGGAGQVAEERNERGAIVAPVPEASKVRAMPFVATHDEEKRLATAIARLALVGVTVHRLEGDFGREIVLCTKWAMTREFTMLTDLEAWASRVAGESQARSSRGGSA